MIPGAQVACASASSASLLSRPAGRTTTLLRGGKLEPKHGKPAGFYHHPSAQQREVAFKTADGWTIHGTLTVPVNLRTDERLPAALLLHSSRHSHTAWLSFPGWARIQESIVTLRIDCRGRGRSEGPIRFADMSEPQRAKVALDVAAAIDFLSQQREVDASRLGIAVEERNATAAVMGAMGDPRVRVFVFLSGILSQEALDLIGCNGHKSMLFLVSNEDQPSRDNMTEAFGLVKGADSELWLQDGLGVGLTMCNMWRNKYLSRPIEEAIDFQAGDWLLNKLRGSGSIEEITLQTDDGWLLYGNLGLPYACGPDNPAPALILLPTALTDRQIYARLERLLLDAGIAFLNLEYRGIGKSVNKGLYLVQTMAEMIAGRRDVHQGLNYLSSRNEIDSNRTGILGGILAAKYALYTAKENPKVKAIAMLDPVTWPWDEETDREMLASVGRPVLMVSGEGMGELTRNFAKLAAENPANKLITSPGGVVSYLLFERDNTLEPTIVEWFKSNLA